MAQSAALTEAATNYRCDTAKALTEEQRQFAAKNHGLIYSFLNAERWVDSEYYDIAAFGYLSAVRRYLTQPRLQKYAFSTIAWRAMGRSISYFRQAEQRRREAERRYLETVHRTDPMAELEARLVLQDLASSSSPEQYQLAVLRLQGYSIVETARLQGMTPERVRKLLRELYRVYFQLYPN